MSERSNEAAYTAEPGTAAYERLKRAAGSPGPWSARQVAEMIERGRAGVVSGHVPARARYELSRIRDARRRCRVLAGAALLALSAAVGLLLAATLVGDAAVAAILGLAGILSAVALPFTIMPGLDAASQLDAARDAFTDVVEAEQ